MLFEERNGKIEQDIKDDKRRKEMIEKKNEANRKAGMEKDSLPPLSYGINYHSKDLCAKRIVLGLGLWEGRGI